MAQYHPIYSGQEMIAMARAGRCMRCGSIYTSTSPITGFREHECAQCQVELKNIDAELEKRRAADRRKEARRQRACGALFPLGGD
jgi:hypothetical protein